MKRFAALLLAALLCAAALTGCKIEFPDDLAVIPPLSSSASSDVSAPSAPTEAAPEKTDPVVTTAAANEARGTTTASRPLVTAASTTATTAAVKPTAAKDKYQTDPIPAGKPQPVEPENTAINRKKTGTCTLSVDCLTILDNKDKLKKEKLSVLPADGIVYKERTVLFYEGESVYDVLNREMKKYRIHMASRSTPIYNSRYIEAIQNLYEFDCGDLSGWTYQVNGWHPNYGCSRYMVRQGDAIKWRYTCDLGRDVGCDFLEQND